MADESIPEVYLLHVWIRQISPMIGRRLLVRSDSSLAALHDTIPVAFGWTDSHLHRFRIHGRDYGISRLGGPAFSRDARRSSEDVRRNASSYHALSGGRFRLSDPLSRVRTWFLRFQRRPGCRLVVGEVIWRKCGGRIDPIPAA